MNSRFTLALFAAMALSASAALAGPPGGGIGIGAGAHGGIGVGAPPLGVPPMQQPPAHVPPVGVPKPLRTSAPPAGANVNGRTNAGAHGALVLHGTISAVSGTSVTMKLGSGTTQSYTVSSQTASRLQSDVGKTIAYRVENGVLTLVAAGAAPMQGTLVGITGTAAQIKLANGTTQTYTVSAQQAAWLRAHAGKHLAFWTSANGTIELNQSSHRSATSQARSKSKHTH
ncbi:MAG TPA: hypothetical protein VFN37_01270 [Candidatus Baltobacteraceae bacterium]|nr:hypothetical protein [Candidatus Baltobacteraceae bacterium]